MNILSKTDFCSIINDLKRNDEFLDDIGDVFRKYKREDQVYSTGLEDTVVSLLEIIFKDKEAQWISYWVWELNYGETYNEGDVTEEDGTNITLRSAEVLYDFLIKNSGEGVNLHVRN